MTTKYHYKEKESWGDFFRRLLGFGESKFLSTWFIIATLLSVVAQITALISCMSANTQSVYLFRVSTDDLINAATNITSIKAQELRVDGLPNHWYWGFSGVCAVYASGNVFCQRIFSPSMTTLDMISFAIKQQLDANSPPDVISNRMKPWTAALEQVQDRVASAASAASFSKASAAMILISTLMSFALLVMGVYAWKGRLHRWIVYSVAFVCAMIYLTSGILAIYSMDQGPRGLIRLSGINQGNERTFIGPGFYVLFAGLLFAFTAIPILFFVVFWAFLLALAAVMMCLSCCCGAAKEDETAN